MGFLKSMKWNPQTLRERGFINVKRNLVSQLISQISLAKFPIFCMNTLIEISVGDGIAILGGKLVKN